MTPHAWIALVLVSAIHLALSWARVPDAAEHAISMATAFAALLVSPRAPFRKTDRAADDEREEARRVLLQWVAADREESPDIVLAAAALARVRASREALDEAAAALDAPVPEPEHTPEPVTRPEGVE